MVHLFPEHWVEDYFSEKVGFILFLLFMLHVWVCVCVFSHVWLFATLWTVTCQAPWSMEFSRQAYWSGLPFPSPEESSWIRDRTCIACVSCTGSQILYHSATLQRTIYNTINLIPEYIILMIIKSFCMHISANTFLKTQILTNRIDKFIRQEIIEYFGQKKKKIFKNLAQHSVCWFYIYCINSEYRCECYSFFKGMK